MFITFTFVDVAVACGSCAVSGYGIGIGGAGGAGVLHTSGGVDATMPPPVVDTGNTVVLPLSLAVAYPRWMCSPSIEVSCCETSRVRFESTCHESETTIRARPASVWQSPEIDLKTRFALRCSV